MRISFCFILPEAFESRELSSFFRLVHQSSLKWFGLFSDPAISSRFYGEELSLILSPEDWGKLDLNDSFGANIQSFKGVSDLSVLGKKGFCIFIDNFEDLLLREELLYVVLSSDCPIIVKCRSIETIHYFIKKYNPDFHFHIYGDQRSKVLKQYFDDSHKLRRFYNWKLSREKDLLFVRAREVKKFFRVDHELNLKGVYFEPGIEINSDILLKSLSLKSWDNQDLEVSGRFIKNQKDSLFLRLKNIVFEQFIQWHYGARLV